MPSGGPLRILTVCEAAADHRTGAALADRVFVDEIDWVEEELLDSLREWCGLDSSAEYLIWTHINREADERNVITHGKFAGEPGMPDARITRRVLLMLERLDTPPDVVILLRDSDGDLTRRTGLNQGRDAVKCSFPVVIGIAHPKRECWLLAAFNSSTSQSKRVLTKLKRELGSDPCANSHKLTARKHGAQREAKRVWDALAPNMTADEEVEMLRRAPRSQLDKHGANNGLVEYLDECSSGFVPKFTSRR